MCGATRLLGEREEELEALVGGVEVEHRELGCVQGRPASRAGSTGRSRRSAGGVRGSSRRAGPIIARRKRPPSRSTGARRPGPRSARRATGVTTSMKFSARSVSRRLKSRSDFSEIGSSTKALLIRVLVGIWRKSCRRIGRRAGIRRLRRAVPQVSSAARAKQNPQAGCGAGGVAGSMAVLGQHGPTRPCQCRSDDMRAQRSCNRRCAWRNTGSDRFVAGHSWPP